MWHAGVLESYTCMKDVAVQCSMYKKASPVWRHFYVVLCACSDVLSCERVRACVCMLKLSVVVFPVSALSDPEAREQSLITLFHSLPPVNFKTAVFLFRHLRTWVCLCVFPLWMCLAVKWCTFYCLFCVFLFVVVVFQGCGTQGGK